MSLLKVPGKCVEGLVLFLSHFVWLIFFQRRKNLVWLTVQKNTYLVCLFSFILFYFVFKAGSHEAHNDLGRHELTR